MLNSVCVVYAMSSWEKGKRSIAVGGNRDILASQQAFVGTRPTQLKIETVLAKTGRLRLVFNFIYAGGKIFQTTNVLCCVERASLLAMARHTLLFYLLRRFNEVISFALVNVSRPHKHLFVHI